MQSREVEFQYKGSRDYIHGTDMFNLMTSGYSSGELNNIRFSVHGFVQTPVCWLIESSDKPEADQIKDTRARCQFESNGKMHYLVLVEGEGKDGKRYEYDEESIVCLTDAKGDRLHLQGQSPFSFIETIVAMNKHHLQTLFPEAPGKWVFTRIDLIHDCDERSSLGLMFRHNMNFRLTKSDVLVNGEKIGDIYFSLVKS